MNLLLYILALLLLAMMAWLSERISPRAPRWVALIGLLLAGLWLGLLYLGSSGPIWAETTLAWIPRFGINVVLSRTG